MSNAFERFFKEKESDGVPHVEEKKRVTGKIIKVQMAPEGEEESEEMTGGWGFISSFAIPYTRIFFHWTSLRQDTLRFPDLRNGMKVEFTPVEVEGKGWRAIKIVVLPEEPK